MFSTWVQRGRSAQPPIIPQMTNTPCPNPLDWSPGVPVPLNASHASDFENALVIPELQRHILRRVNGADYDFVDYDLRITPRQGEVSRVRIRCLQNGVHGWDTLLLRLHDEFAYDTGFRPLLDDPTGVFIVEDDPSGQPVDFSRLNSLRDPWEVQVCPRCAVSAPGQPGPASFTYWDYSRQTDAEEEFLFIEQDGDTGWTRLWRGGVFRV